MRWILILMVFFSTSGFAQWKDYRLNSHGDTLNRVDMQGRKQGPWSIRYESVRGEPGYEEEGWFKNDRKEGEWRLYSLMGDLVGIENYKWGFKDGICSYFSMHGDLRLEQSWKALNPDKAYDTLEVEDVDNLNQYKTVIVKNEGAFYKKAVGKIMFSCKDGDKINEAVEQAIATGESVTVDCKTTGTNDQNEVVAEFNFTWSFKARRKDVSNS